MRYGKGGWNVPRILCALQRAVKKSAPETSVACGASWAAVHACALQGEVAIFRIARRDQKMAISAPQAQPPKRVSVLSASLLPRCADERESCVRALSQATQVVCAGR